MNTSFKKPQATLLVMAALALCGGSAAFAQDARLPEPAARQVQPGKSGLAPIGAPAAPTLKHLTLQGNTVAAGNAACPNQPYYLYSGGKPDGYAAVEDQAFPSAPLVSLISASKLVAYDSPAVNKQFGDSFNLQHTRGVCYALVQFRVKSNQTDSANDGLTLGHVTNSSQPFAVVAQVINPAALGPGVLQSYALDATGRNLLSAQTGWGMDKTRDQSVLDVYLQDDTALDFFRIFVWYGPNCTSPGTASGVGSGC